MSSLKILWATLVAAFALGAMSTSAPANEFEYSTLPILLLAAGDGLGLQVLNTLAATLTCKTLKGHHLVSEINFKTLKLTDSYSGCVMKGGAGVTGKPDEPITAEYEYNAEGTVTILNPITILATLAGIKCAVTAPPQGPFSVKHRPTDGGTVILVLTHISALETSAKGAACLEAYTSSKTGLFIGNSIIFADGGTVAWSGGEEEKQECP